MSNCTVLPKDGDADASAELVQELPRKSSRSQSAMHSLPVRSSVLFLSLSAALTPSSICSGVYLTDLVFIEDGNPDESDGLINFYKVRNRLDLPVSFVGIVLISVL